MLLVLASAAAWGTWSLFLRPTHLPGIVTTPIVFATMAIVGFPLSLREPAARWDRGTVALLAANAVADALNVACFFTAIDYTTVQIAVLSHYATPILVALAAPRVDRVTTPGARPAAAVALAGLVIILEPWTAPADGAIVGAALGLASAVCYATNVFVVRRLVDRIGSARATSYHSAAAALLLLPFAAAGLPDIAPRALAIVVAGAIGPGTIAGIAFGIGLARIGSARSAVLTFAEPIVAVACGALVWDEPLHAVAAVGGAMILGAGIYVSRRAAG
jgi:drug/metabolite transporter (DMT)-like permease